MLGDPTGADRQTSTVMTARSTTSATAPAAAPPATSPAPAPVTPKCEVSPRQAWVVMTATSTEQAPASTLSTVVLARGRTAANESTHVTVVRVRPKDTPKVAGFRHDSGPLQVPPVTMSTPRWKSPLTTSTTASR